MSIEQKHELTAGGSADTYAPPPFAAEKSRRPGVPTELLSMGPLAREAGQRSGEIPRRIDTNICPT